MSNEELKKEIKQVVTKLGNIKFTIEDELEFCKQVLKRKEQECEYWKHQAELGVDTTDRLTKELEEKEQECEVLKKELHKNFEEKDTLHLIIDRLLEASGYDTNIASAEDFEDVYENMRYAKQQLDQLKADREEALKQLEFVRTLNTVQDAENRKLSKTLAEIKEIAEGCQYGDCHECKYQPRTDCRTELIVQILQKISEVTDV